MNARLNTPAHFAFLDTAEAVEDSDLLTAAFFQAGSSVADVELSQDSDVPELFITAAHTFTAAGLYEIRWSYDGTVIQTDPLTVGFDPASDAVVNEATDVFLYAAEDGERQVRVVDSAGEVVAEQDDAAYDEGSKAYKRESVTFETQGSYFAVWYVDTGGGTWVPSLVKRVAVFVPRGYEKLRFKVYDSSGGGNGTPHTGASVLVSTDGGALVTKVPVGATGRADALVPPGVYILTVHKAGKVYTKNNWPLTVVDTETAVGNNEFVVDTGVFTPTLSEPEAPLTQTKLFGWVYSMYGTPCAGSAVLVSLVGKTYVVSGKILADGSRTLRADANGYFEVSLAQGATVEFAFSAISFNRRITVPVSNDPVNVATLLSDAADPFTAVNPSLEFAVRRS